MHFSPRENAWCANSRGLDDNERRFLLSLVAGTPDCSLLGIAHLEHLPGIRWKLHNLAQLQKTNAKKFAEQADVLEAKLLTGTSPAKPLGNG
jgi:predicted transcriptional regulator